MVRTQVQLHESQYEQIRSLAHRNHISLAEAVRRLLRVGLEVGLEEPDRDAGTLMALAGIGSSGLGDLGRNHDDHLDEAFDS